MLTMVAVLPEPPLLGPELATGASAGVRQLRAAVADAAARLTGAARCWIAVGSDPGGRRTVGPLYSAAPHGATYHVAVWTPAA